MIHEKSTRHEKHARCKKLARKSAAMNDSREVHKTRKTCAMQETCEKKGEPEITRKLTTHILRFNYFLVQLNFILYCKKKSLRFMHNYRFYCEMVREICLMKQHKQYKMTPTYVSHLTDFWQIIGSRLKRSSAWDTHRCHCSSMW